MKRKRAEANRKKLSDLGRRSIGGPGLLLSQRCSTANATYLDFVDAGLRDLIKVNKPRLNARARRGSLTPTETIVLELLALVVGLKGAGGCFLQLPLYGEVKFFGAGESTLQRAHANLQRKGFIERFEQTVESEWFENNGRRHIIADVWSKMRITPAGLAELRRQGELYKRMGGRVLVAAGVRDVWKSCERVFRMLVRRFGVAAQNETPPLGGKTPASSKPSNEARPAGRGPLFRAERRRRASDKHAGAGRPAATAGPAPPAAVHDGPTRWAVARPREVDDLVRRHAVTAALAFPDAWRLAADSRARLSLLELFEALQAPEVRRRVLAAAGPGELAGLRIQIAAQRPLTEQLRALVRAEAAAGAKKKWFRKVDANAKHLERQGRLLEREARRR